VVIVPHPSPEQLQELAPTGELRVVINLGNPMLTRRDANGDIGGISVDMALAMAQSLGVPVQLSTVDGAAKSVALVRGRDADLGFFALDPLRSEGIAFTGAYVHIEGAYLVREDSALRSNDEVDQAGVRVAVGKGSAYDLFLSRALKHASLVRTATGNDVMPAFHEQGLEVAAGIRQPLEKHAVAGSGLRMLPGRFMVIEQAMGIPDNRSTAAQAWLRAFAQAAIAQGFVAQRIAVHQVEGASVAPLAK
jgi:polar amino acid transport system substrate-binding protein